MDLTSRASSAPAKQQSVQARPVNQSFLSQISKQPAVLSSSAGRSGRPSGNGKESNKLPKKSNGDTSLGTAATILAQHSPSTTHVNQQGGSKTNGNPHYSLGREQSMAKPRSRKRPRVGKNARMRQRREDDECENKKYEMTLFDMVEKQLMLASAARRNNVESTAATTTTSMNDYHSLSNNARATVNTSSSSSPTTNNFDYCAGDNNVDDDHISISSSSSSDSMSSSDDVSPEKKKCEEREQRSQHWKKNSAIPSLQNYAAQPMTIANQHNIFNPPPSSTTRITLPSKPPSQIRPRGMSLTDASRNRPPTVVPAALLRHRHPPRHH